MMIMEIGLIAGEILTYIDKIEESFSFDDYNTPLDSDHWLRWKNMVEYQKPGGQNAEAKKVSERI